MEIVTPSYIFDILQADSATDQDTINVKVGDLREFGKQCEDNGRFLRHPYFMTADEAAKYLNVTTQTIYDWIASGKVHAHKVGRKWMIREVDIIFD